MSTHATGTALTRTSARWMSKRYVVFAGVIGGIAGLAMSTRTWIHVVPAQGAINVQPFDVSGQDAATAVAALAVVALAGSVAAAIAGRFARWVIAVLVFLSGLGITGSAATALSDPVAAAVSKVGTAAGTLRIQGDYQVTFWPWCTLVVGIWIMGAAIWLAVASRRWKTSRKYTPATAATGVAGAAPGPTAPDDGGAARDDEAGRAGTMDEIDGWDSLSRGDDPTR
ncbi:Trp biosynthesis-associated membrane protein [Arthrobacter sp. JSM 101049]|uniref:Trp biosynthesis-associated membrane protein n=1 Tax=Arthrobacter sp. JSM 101049 TaxID=929097 RepID=UPI00356A5446